MLQKLSKQNFLCEAPEKLFFRFAINFPFFSEVKSSGSDGDAKFLIELELD